MRMADRGIGPCNRTGKLRDIYPSAISTMTYQEASQNADKKGWFVLNGYELFESARQEYAGLDDAKTPALFAAGLVSDESASPRCDVVYLAAEKLGQDYLLWMLRPDEMAAIARLAASALWSNLIVKIAE